MGTRRQDYYGKQARIDGYAARSVYKLEEIDRRVRLIRQGQRILDLGASPGSWTQYAAQKVGRQGKVVALDLKEPRGVFPPQVDYRVCDAREQTPETLGGVFDVVLSDMAPATTGTRNLDQYRSYELFVFAVDIASQVLRPGGDFVGKIFQGPEFEAAREHLRRHFAKVRIIRPEATRDESYELFLVGLGRRDAPLPAKAVPPDEEAEED